MGNKQFINWCDKGMAFSFCALIYFLPISIALTEIFTVMTFFFYVLKRSAHFLGVKKEMREQGQASSFGVNVQLFLKSFKPVESFLNWPITVFIFASGLSIVFSSYRIEGIEGFVGKVLQSAFLYFNFIECMRSKKRIKIFLTVFFISCGLSCVNGIVQYFSGEGFVRHSLIDDGRISSSLRAPNDFAAYLVIAIPVLFSSFVAGIRRQKQTDVHEPLDSFAGYFKKLRLITLILFLLAAICLGLTYSRGAWVGFILSMAVFGVINRKMFLPFALIVIIFSAFFFPSLARNRNPIHDKRSFQHENNRLKYWKRALDIIEDYPVVGSGLNTYSIVSQGYEEGWGGYPHNSYLQMTSETGAIGICAFLWVLLALFRYCFQALKEVRCPSEEMLLLGSSTGLLGFLIHGIFDTNFYSVQLGSLMWVMMGLIVATGMINANQEVLE